MFDIGWDEMALVAVVALLVIGPKDLPKVLRQVGIWTRKAKDMAGEFQRGMDDMVRESDLADLKATVEKAANPHSIKSTIENTVDPNGVIAKGLEAPMLPPVMDAPKPAPASVEPAQPAVNLPTMSAAPSNTDTTKAPDVGQTK